VRFGEYEEPHIQQLELGCMRYRTMCSKLCIMYALYGEDTTLEIKGTFTYQLPSSIELCSRVCFAAQCTEDYKSEAEYIPQTTHVTSVAPYQ
jgi:hypothetical protein